MQEGAVTYIDISTNPDLTPKESQVPSSAWLISQHWRQAVANNLKIQTQNQVPFDFPTFVREGFDVKVIADGYIQDPNGSSTQPHFTQL